MTPIATSEAKLSDLVSFFNVHVVRLQDGKPVKKFADRKTAEKRVNDLVERLASYFHDQPEELATVPDEKMIFIGDLVDEDGEPIQIEASDVKPVATLPDPDSEEEPEEDDQPNSFGAMGKAIGAMADKPEPRASAAGRASNSLGVALSWLVPDVRVRRLTRDSVEVTVDGATSHFKSAQDAFRLYRLPESKFIRFRIKLKADRSQVFEFGGKSYLFQIVDGVPEDEAAE